MEKALADGEPHTFVELYRLLEGRVRPDDAAARYNRDNSGPGGVPLATRVLLGKRRIIQQMLANLKRRGFVTQEGQGLTSSYRLVPDEATRRAILDALVDRRVQRARAGQAPLGRPPRAKPKAEVTDRSDEEE